MILLLTASLIRLHFEQRKCLPAAHKTFRRLFRFFIMFADKISERKCVIGTSARQAGSGKNVAKQFLVFATRLQVALRLFPAPPSQQHRGINGTLKVLTLTTTPSEASQFMHANRNFFRSLVAAIVDGRCCVLAASEEM